MFVNIIFLAIIIQLPYTIISTGSCTPNSQFVINGFLCKCNSDGRWNQASCKMIGRRSDCVPGESVRRGCTQCICRDNNFMCDSSLCFNEVTSVPILKALTHYGPTCTPFRSYFVNCTICFCPASGRTLNAQCVIDYACASLSHAADTIHATTNRCLPDVMYLFPCLQCVCTEKGEFIPDKCVDTCNRTTTKPNPRCIPGSLYRANCTVCQCPENSIPNDKLCEQVECSNDTLTPIMQPLNINGTSCTPHKFTEPKCLYCDCEPKGAVSKNSCIEINCPKLFELKRDISFEACIPGELIPLCVECFCLGNKSVLPEYCTKNCSVQNKLEILDKVLNKSIAGSNLIDDNQISEANDTCVPSSLYLDNGRYCLCPKQSNMSLRACTLYYKSKDIPTTNLKRIEIDFNASCKPNSLVEFQCNTCYCSKEGKINPKWCTYDDCESHNMIKESHKSHIVKTKTSCVPGSIVTSECNYCICPESGIFNDNAHLQCTKNVCDTNKTTPNEKFTCDPSNYYEVDCNICLCPADGLKNINKCTANSCETTFLRSNFCMPGRLFSDDCNVCVCPTNGKREDKVCTKRNCEAKTWTYKFQQTLLSDTKVKRNLEACFPGEEYTEGCKSCVCPEEGLKMYGACDVARCNVLGVHNLTMKRDNPSDHIRERRDVANQRLRQLDVKFNITLEKKLCTAGSYYIIRCRYCICPYSGSIYDYCRPLPPKMYCEQRYPGINYRPAERRGQNLNITFIFSPLPGKEIAKQMDKEIDKEIDKKKDKKIDKEINKVIDKKINKEKDKEMYKEKDKEINKEIDKKKHKKTDKEKHKETNKEMDKQIDKEKDKEKYKEIITETDMEIIKEMSLEQETLTKYPCNGTRIKNDSCFICECEENFIIEERCFRSSAKNCVNATISLLNVSKIIN